MGDLQVKWIVMHFF